jgi:hypothetical protein
MPKPQAASSRALAAVGVFLVFGACMAALAGTTLVWPGTPLDKVWRLNATAYRQLAPAGSIGGFLFLLLSAALATAAVGWFKRYLWAWRLAVVIIATQVAGDFFNLVRGDFLGGAVGMAIAGALLFYMLCPSVRSAFALSG